jgi:hypothetical protein
MKKRVFLGGTCNNGTNWREKIIPFINIDYFNPVVSEWDDEAYRNELREREECDYCLYLITPKMSGVYSIAEVIDDSNKRPNKTIFCFVLHDEGDVFNNTQIKSLNAVGKMVETNGGFWAKDVEELLNKLNSDI